jgi:hypothetical protein
MNISSVFEPFIMQIVAISLIAMIPALITSIKNIRNNTAEIEDELLELYFDNSEYVNNKRLELEEQKYIANIKEQMSDESVYRYNPYSSTRCQYCGTKHDDIEKHCSACGASL